MVDWMKMSRIEFEVELLGTAVRRQTIGEATIEVFANEFYSGWCLWTERSTIYKEDRQRKEMLQRDCELGEVYRAARWLHEHPFCVPRQLHIVTSYMLDDFTPSALIVRVESEFDFLDCAYDWERREP